MLCAPIARALATLLCAAAALPRPLPVPPLEREKRRAKGRARVLNTTTNGRVGYWSTTVSYYARSNYFGALTARREKPESLCVSTNKLARKLSEASGKYLYFLR